MFQLPLAPVLKSDQTGGTSIPESMASAGLQSAHQGQFLTTLVSSFTHHQYAWSKQQLSSSIWDLLGPGQTFQKQRPLCLKNIFRKGKNVLKRDGGNVKGRSALHDTPPHLTPKCATPSLSAIEPHSPHPWLSHGCIALVLLTHSAPQLQSWGPTCGFPVGSCG